MKNIFKSFVRLLNSAVDFIASLLGVERTDRKTSQEIKDVIREGRKSGAIAQTEHQLIERIFEFTDKLAKDIMVPHSNIIAINIDDPRNKIFNTVTEEGYSRLPVFKNTIDNIIGVIYTKDLIPAAEYRELIAIQDIIRPAYFVASTKPIGSLMKEMQKQSVHMGIVVNEYGGVEGLITMEDIIEEIVGDIRDEYDLDYQEIVKGKEGDYFVDPIISIGDFNKNFKCDIPPDQYYNTLGGFLCKVTGHIPDLYERIDYAGFTFIITKKQRNAMKQIKVIRKD